MPPFLAFSDLSTDHRATHLTMATSCHRPPAGASLLVRYNVAMPRCVGRCYYYYYYYYYKRLMWLISATNHILLPRHARQSCSLYRLRAQERQRFYVIIRTMAALSLSAPSTCFIRSRCDIPIRSIIIS